MTVHAWHFAISHGANGTLVGRALLCPAVRYASTLLFGTPRVGRGFAEADTWPLVELEVEYGWGDGLVPASSNVVRLLLTEATRTHCRLRLVMDFPVAIDGPADATSTLDSFLEDWRAP